jgi:hypothetical protein
MTSFSSQTLAALVSKQIAYGAYFGPDAANLIGAELQAQGIDATDSDLEAADRALCARQVDGARPPRIPDVIRAIRAQTVRTASQNAPPELASYLALFPETKHQALKREYFSTVKAGWTRKQAIEEIKRNHDHELNQHNQAQAFQPRFNQ